MSIDGIFDKQLFTKLIRNFNTRAICRHASWPFSKSKLKYSFHFSFERPLTNLSSSSQILFNCNCYSAVLFSFSSISLTSCKTWFNFLTYIWNNTTILALVFVIAVYKQYNVWLQTTEHRDVRNTLRIDKHISLVTRHKWV